MNRISIGVVLFAILLSCPDSWKSVQLFFFVTAGFFELLYTMWLLIVNDIPPQMIVMCMNPLMLYSFLYVTLILTSYAVYEYCAYHTFVLELSYKTVATSMSWNDDMGLLHYILLYNSVSDAAQYACAKLWTQITGRETTRVGVPCTNKSYEGYLSGLIVPYVFFSLVGPDVSISPEVMVLFNALGMLGGLFSSFIKRSMRVKHWSNLLGPHGGVNDRLDSFLLPACVVMIGVLKNLHRV